jgi:hypothetical protein
MPTNSFSRSDSKAPTSEAGKLAAQAHDLPAQLEQEMCLFIFPGKLEAQATAKKPSQFPMRSDTRPAFNRLREEFVARRPRRA